MPTTTQIASGRWVADAATVWDGGVVPPIGNDVDATGDFDLTVDDDTNAVNTFNRAGSSGTLTIDNTKTVDVDGTCTLDGPVAGAGTIAASGDFTALTNTTFDGNTTILLDGTGNVSFSTSDANANIEVNTAGTHTLALPLACKDITLTAGTLVDAGYAVTVGGNLQLNAGTLTSTAAWTMNGSGSFNIAANGNNLVVKDLTIGPNVTATTTAAVYTKKLTIQGALSGPHLIDIWAPSAAWWGTQTGTISATMYVINASAGPGADVVLSSMSGKEVRVYKTSGAVSLTWGGDLDVGAGDLILRSLEDADDKYVEIDMEANSLKVGGTLTLGHSNKGSGRLKLGEGSHSINALADGNALNHCNTVAMEKCYLEAGGTLDLDNITHSADADDLVHIVCTGTGEIKNFDPAQIVHCHGDASVDGGGNNGANNKATFNTHAPPGSRVLMGAGV